jgi:predicted PurR-regulated permease PerM
MSSRPPVAGAVDRPAGGSSEPDRPWALASPRPAEGGGTAEDGGFGEPGRPMNRRSPFFIGLTGALGVAVAYVLFRVVADVGQVLTLIGLALFLAVGLDPAVAFLTGKGMPRWSAVLAVVLTLVAIVGAFAAAAAGPIAREAHQLQVNLPRWENDVRTGKGWLGHLAKQLHLSSSLRSKKVTTILTPSTVAGGVLGAGKVIVGALSAVVVVGVLTVYFLVALPSVHELWLRLVPATRRERAAALTDEVLSRVGGFVLGNLLTSLVAGVGTWLWLTAFGVPYPFLLGLLVALLDLVPVVGSTIGGLIVSLVALVVSLPVALGTLAFYVAYRFFEDYLLTPRVMRHTVRISPGLTIVATLIGGVLLGLIGALIAIPVAAGVHLVLEEVTFPALDRK